MLFRLILAGLMCALWLPQAMACSCIPPLPASEAFKSADAVFVGSVTSFGVRGEPEKSDFDGREVLAFRQGRQAVFRVKKAYKGVQEETITVFTGEGGGDCGFDFIVGHEYLIYANTSDGQLYAGICSRIKDVWFSNWQDAKEDFDFLESLNK